MTAEFPWTSVGVATGYRGNPRISAPGFPRQFFKAHGTSTANAKVVATARAAVLFGANSVVPTIAAHGSPRRKLPWLFSRLSAAIATATRQSPRNSAEVRGKCQGSFRGRPTAEIFTTAIRGRGPLPRQSSNTRQIPRKFVEVRGNCHGSFRGRPTAAIFRAIRRRPRPWRQQRPR